MSESTMSAPTAGMGLTLAAAGFVGMYMQGLGQARVWAASTASSVSRCATTAVLGPDFSGCAHVAWWKKTPESHQGKLMSYPQLRWDWEQHQQECTLWAHTTGKRDTTEHTDRGIAPKEEYSVASLPAGVLQSHLYCTIDHKHSQKSYLGPLLQQIGSRPHTWPSSDKQTAKRRPC